MFLLLVIQYSLETEIHTQKKRRSHVQDVEKRKKRIERRKKSCFE